MKRLKQNSKAGVIGALYSLGATLVGLLEAQFDGQIAALATIEYWQAVKDIYFYAGPTSGLVAAAFKDSPSTVQQPETAVQHKVATVPQINIDANRPDPVISGLPDLSGQSKKNAPSNDDTIVVTVPRSYFDQAELECKGTDCGCRFPGMGDRIMLIANDAREHLGPLIVNSAFRCPDYNRVIGGVENSQHVKAKALDLRSPNMSSDELYNWFDRKYPDTLGLGLYDRFVHVDSRTEKARWNNKTAAMVP